MFDSSGQKMVWYTSLARIDRIEAVVCGRESQPELEVARVSA